MIDVKDTERQGLDPALTELLQDPATGQYLVCGLCSHVITQAAHAMDVNGAHQHNCTNPHGFEYLVGCYAQALGCDIKGERNHADSWFPGYQWRLASCGDCQQHLGWYFDTADDFFYGLITERLHSA